MEDKENIIGFFTAVEHRYNETEEEKRQVDVYADQFCNYIWGKSGLADRLQILQHKNYGKDFKLILFEFQLFPNDRVIELLPEIGRYRPKEKSIGISIIVNNENFFHKSEHQREEFIKSSILRKLDLLAGLVSRRKYDTDMSGLQVDISKLLVDWPSST